MCERVHRPEGVPAAFALQKRWDEGGAGPASGVYAKILRRVYPESNRRAQNDEGNIPTLTFPTFPLY